MKNALYFAWSYPAQKFGGAVHTLATCFAPGWQRMLYALMERTALQPDHFPERDLYDRYSNLLKQAREFGPLYIGQRPYWGSLENTLRRRRRVTLSRYAREIVAISEAIESRRGSYID